MKTKLQLISVLAAGLALHGAAMPTEAEVEKAVPKVERMLASEKVALASGKMTRAEVAAAAMRLAAGADDEAAKLLLMKGAFILHVKDGDLEKAVKTMNALETAIADMPPQIITNIIETALLGLPNKAANGARLYRLLDATKIAEKSAIADGENLKAVADGYTWTYRVKNGEAEIVAEKEGKFSCAVSPKPTGHVAIPSTLGGARVTSIGSHAFHYCEGIASVAIPASVTNIGRGAFWRCSSLKSVTIPSGVRSIGCGAFWRCQGLSTVKIPASVENIGEGAFSDCYCLKHINVDVGNQWFASVDGVLYTKDLKELVMCPNALLSMKILPDVRFIWQWASDSCSKLTFLTIPEKVTNIGKEAFEGCEKLTSVTMLGECPSAPNDIFKGCANLKSIHVPANAKSWAGMKEWQGVPLVFDSAFSSGEGGLYCVIDISGGEKAERYPVSYLDAVPEGGWTDEYKTTKIVLRRIDAGTWPMMGNRQVTFTKPFYIGIFELTQKQVKLISGMPDRKFVFEGDMRPADCLSWEEMRGKDEEFDYPKTKEVAPGSIIGKLRAKTGISRIDLQTSYQFGCAWNAGTDGKDRDVRLTGRHHSNQGDGKGGYNSRHTVVGSYQPNEWGIYDLHGNVWEVCLDRLGLRSSETDPEGPVGGERRRNLLGGCWNSADGFVFATDCVPNTKDKVGDSGKCGYRIVINAMPDEKKDFSSAVHKSVESILKGMIKVPGRDYWLSATEVTQEQWEPIMEYNLSKHKGPNLPVECVNRDDCDVFLEKLNQTKEVQGSQFEFCLPTEGDWLYAAQAGGAGWDCWIKPGVVGDILDMAWVKENSSNETHAVATKAANAFGFYDMRGNVWEWLANEQVSKGCRRGGAFNVDIGGCSVHRWIHTPRGRRYGDCGLRLAAHKRVRPLLGGLRRPGSSNNGQRGGSLRARRLQRQQEAQKTDLQQATVDGYTWSYRVKNGEVTIVAENRGRSSCAITPSPKGNLTIPSTLGGMKVTSIGRDAFNGCYGVTSITMPSSVKDIGIGAFLGCGVSSVSISSNVVNIGYAAFAECAELEHINVDEGNQNYVSVDGALYTKDRMVLVQCPGGAESVTLPEGLKSICGHALRGCCKLKSVTIPCSVKEIGEWAFAKCTGLTSMMIPDDVTSIANSAFRECAGLTTVAIPEGVTSIGGAAFAHCGGLKFLMIPSNVTVVAEAAFSHCSKLESVTMPPAVKSIEPWMFDCCERLTSVTIPERVTNIKDCAFRACTNLTSVTILGEHPSTSNDIFKDCSKLKSIHVPANAKSWTGMKEWQGIPLAFDAK